MMRSRACIEEGDLWTQWFQEHNLEVRQQLFEYYAEWMVQQAKNIYRKYNIQSCELNDYIQYATIGLLESIDRFNPEIGNNFKAFSIKRLKGEIFNNINKFSEKSHGNEQIRKINKAKAIAFIEHGKNYQFESLVDLTLDLYILQLLEYQNFFYPKKESFGPFQSIEFEQLKVKIINIISELNTNEQIIIRYHYYYHWSFMDIAGWLDISKGRVSQIHKEAIRKIKKHYLAYLE